MGTWTQTIVKKRMLYKAVDHIFLRTSKKTRLHIAIEHWGRFGGVGVVCETFFACPSFLSMRYGRTDRCTYVHVYMGYGKCFARRAWENTPPGVQCTDEILQRFPTYVFDAAHRTYKSLKTKLRSTQRTRLKSKTKNRRIGNHKLEETIANCRIADC